MVFTISDFEKIDFKADVLTAHHPVQTARLTILNRVKELRTMDLEGTWVNGVGSLSAPEKSPPSNRL